MDDWESNERYQVGVGRSGGGLNDFASMQMLELISHSHFLSYIPFRERAGRRYFNSTLRMHSIYIR